MEMDNKKPHCPVLDVDGVISGGKQFDLDITLPEDNRDVIYGVVKNCFKEPVCDAVVKLVEIVCEHGKEERIKICAKCHHEGKCLKGDKCDKCDCFIESDNKCDKCHKHEDYKEENCFESPECKECK